MAIVLLRGNSTLSGGDDNGIQDFNPGTDRGVLPSAAPHIRKGGWEGGRFRHAGPEHFVQTAGEIGRRTTEPLIEKLDYSQGSTFRVGGGGQAQGCEQPLFSPTSKKIGDKSGALPLPPNAPGPA
eukprot:gene13528-biopygen18561